MIRGRGGCAVVRGVIRGRGECGIACGLLDRRGAGFAARCYLMRGLMWGLMLGGIEREEECVEECGIGRGSGGVWPRRRGGDLRGGRGLRNGGGLLLASLVVALREVVMDRMRATRMVVFADGWEGAQKQAGDVGEDSSAARGDKSSGKGGVEIGEGVVDAVGAAESMRAIYEGQGKVIGGVLAPGMFEAKGAVTTSQRAAAVMPSGGVVAATVTGERFWRFRFWFHVLSLAFAFENFWGRELKVVAWDAICETPRFLRKSS